MSAKKKRTLKVEGKHPYVRPAEPPSTVDDLKAFCPETVDAFLEEAECLLNAAQGRKKLGQWEASFKYQKLVQDRLVRLLKVADLQAAYAGAELVAEEDEEDSSQTAGSKVEAVGAKGAGEGEEAKRVVGPSGSKTKWSNEELDKLYVAAQEVEGSVSKEDMLKVSKAVGTKTAAQCRTKIMQLAHSERITHEWLAQRVASFNEEYKKRQEQDE